MQRKPLQRAADVSPARPPGLVMVLTENWTLWDPRHLKEVVRAAVVAEDSGFETVMLSEHVVLGQDAGEQGVMANPRDYAMPGNQDPTMPWPDSLVLASAIAYATTRIRIALAAVIAPLRHPLLLAKQLATLDLVSGGRLVVQPTVSWHPQEYEALDVPFEQRGARLDDHLDAWAPLWRDTPASFTGRHSAFEDVYLEPKPARPDGPTVWIGGSVELPAVARRLAEHGHGYHPLGQPNTAELEALFARVREGGGDPDRLELIGGIRPRFPADDVPADVDEALEQAPTQVARGYTSICIKPSQYLDDAGELPAWSRRVVERVGRLAA
jgi:probable F420-dependent oxidoreductase